MRRFLTLMGILLLVAAPALAGHGRFGRGTNISISDDDWRDLTDCSQIRVTFDGDRAVMTSEEIAVGGNALRVRSSHHGGIRASGWEGSGYSVKACKAVDSGVDAAAVRVVRSGNELSVDGPDGERWVLYFIVRVPRGATLDLASTNGPIGIAGVNATVTANVKNGPVSVKDSSGKIDVRATNGPISLTGGSGDITMRATNGPLSVKLDGTAWNGTLEAETQNGPVTLKLPRGYRSGVVVESRGHGPVSCRAEDCKRISIYRDSDDDEDDEPRRLELGSGPQAVRLSTVNGPVSIKDRD
jgi:hypothetical protein